MPRDLPAGPYGKVAGRGGESEDLPGQSAAALVDRERRDPEDKKGNPRIGFFRSWDFFSGPRALKGKDQPYNLNRKGVDG